MTLAEAQALFHEALTSDAPPSPAALERCFAGTPDLPAHDRIAIYADMYRWRLVDALRATFPLLARYLGDEGFAGLAGDYLRAHPSEHHDVAQVGRRLVAFLREYPDPERPDLADLAELEWARQEVFFAPPGPTARAPFAGLDAETFARARLVLTPALRLLDLEYDVAGLWRRLEREEPVEPPVPGPAAIAIWRNGFDVLHAPLAPDERAALGTAAAGGTLAEVCAAFAEAEGAAVAAHAALSSWAEEGWIVGLR